MRLYLSSYRLGNQPEKLAALFGDNKNVAVIMNAGDMIPTDAQAGRLAREIEGLAQLGLIGIDLDLKNFVGKREELEQELHKYGGVWIPGGNAFLLRRAMYDSGFDETILSLLKEDRLVYAGYSAAIVIAAPTLIGLDIVDQPSAVQEIYRKEPVWEGLNLIPYSIAPHYQSDHPESAMVEKMVEFFTKENIPFKTLKDGQAIVINENSETLTD